MNSSASFSLRAAALRAAAAGPQDGLGRFRVVPDGPSIRVAGLQVEPAAWHRVLSLGAIEAVHDEGPDLFTFTEAMLPHLVLLENTSELLTVLTAEALEAFTPTGWSVTATWTGGE